MVHRSGMKPRAPVTRLESFINKFEGKIMVRNYVRQALWGGSLLLVASAAMAAKNRPDGYVTICKIGESCSVSQSTNVAFGAADKFVFKVLNGNFSCSVSTFGSD